MLALPIATGVAGFFPALLMFLIAWGFMTISGLFMIEINSWFSKQVNIISMAGHSLGKWGRVVSWILYLFLFYALSVAYISGSGSLCSTLLGGKIPIWVGSTFFVILFGAIVYGGTRQVDLWNRLFMVGKIAAFCGLVVLGMQYVQPGYLLRTEPQGALLSLPILIIAFGYQNMIPTIASYLEYDRKRIKQAIIGGSLLALAIYLIWEFVVLGIVPLEGSWGIRDSLAHDREAAQAMAGILGKSWISGFTQALAFFAVLTSFLSQSLGLVHFLGDGLGISSQGKREPLSLSLLALGPPLIFSLFYPQLFFKALNFAGGICANLLFGLLPALILWKGRGVAGQEERGIVETFGGKTLLLCMILFSLFILLLQLVPRLA
jgi:tyrosine-specific transport protein